MKRKLSYLFGISLILISADQFTKAIILKNFHEGESLTVIQNYFDITYVRNFGAAFGMLSQVESGFRDWFFLIIPPVAIFFILLMLKSARSSERIKMIALSSVFSGAIGNYIDRLRFGFVVDFLDFHYYRDWAWPAFNVADMSIVCGIFILIFIEFFSSSPKDKPGKNSPLESS